MAIGGIGKVGARAAEAATGLVGELMGAGVYPSNEHALAAYLFERIAQAEKEVGTKDRAYYLQLMTVCLATVRDPKSGASGS